MNHVLDPSVYIHCIFLLSRKYPVLLQGPTSAGKTSLVQYLAKATGHQCLRINNHEHTDLQEYIGMYGADEKGELVFQEGKLVYYIYCAFLHDFLCIGVLVEAMRKGYWIILDELNLAPTEVLEALNRVCNLSVVKILFETKTFHFYRCWMIIVSCSFRRQEN